MARKYTLKSLLAVATVSTVALQAPAEAGTEFATLGGIEAEPMSTQEMEATQGRQIFNGWNPFTGTFGTCVLGVCNTGTHFGNLFQPPAGGVTQYPWIFFQNPSFSGSTWDFATQIANQVPAYMLR